MCVLEQDSDADGYKPLTLAELVVAVPGISIIMVLQHYSSSSFTMSKRITIGLRSIVAGCLQRSAWLLS